MPSWYRENWTRTWFAVWHGSKVCLFWICWSSGKRTHKGEWVKKRSRQVSCSILYDNLNVAGGMSNYFAASTPIPSVFQMAARTNQFWPLEKQKSKKNLRWLKILLPAWLYFRMWQQFSAEGIKHWGKSRHWALCCLFFSKLLPFKGLCNILLIVILVFKLFLFALDVAGIEFTWISFDIGMHYVLN